MSKLYYRYGAMESSKSLQLLATAHNYEVSQGKKIMVFKPATDDRSPYVETRAGLKREADVVLERDDLNIMAYIGLARPECILIDEAQFLTREQVRKFSDVVDMYGIPVLAYGLKNDFQNNLFEGTEALFAFADKIEEIKTGCTGNGCMNKATMNMRLLDGVPISEGEQVEIGDTKDSDRRYSYKPVCRKCYKKAFGANLI